MACWLIMVTCKWGLIMFMPDTLVGWVSVVTQVVTAGTAVVMAILGYRTYLQAPEQEPEPEGPEAEASEVSLTHEPVFVTSKQETTLVVSDQGLECHLKDVKTGESRHQWTLNPTQCADVLASGTYSVNPGYKSRTGTFSIGPRRNWLYSKKLFPEPEYLHGVLKQLLQSASG